jgi:hypothetical protein
MIASSDQVNAHSQLVLLMAGNMAYHLKYACGGQFKLIA